CSARRGSSPRRDCPRNPGTYCPDPLSPPSGIAAPLTCRQLNPTSAPYRFGQPRPYNERIDRNGEGLKKRQLVLGVLGLAALVGLFFWGRQKFHFDFHVFRDQIAQANWRKIVIGIGCIYSAFVFRSVRWARLLKHNKKVPDFSLVGTQVMGFTAIALIGRVADPV